MEEITFHKSESLLLRRALLGKQECIKLIEEATKRKESIKKLFVGTDKVDESESIPRDYSSLLQFNNLIFLKISEKSNIKLIVDLINANKNLQTVCIDTWELSDENMKNILGSLLNHKNLSLELEDMDPYLIPLLSDIIHSNCLKGLKINQNRCLKKPLSDFIVKEFTECVSSSNLQFLDLSGLHIGYNSTQYISKMLEFNCTLTKLDLSRTGVDINEIIQGMKKNFYLKELRIAVNPFNSRYFDHEGISSEDELENEPLDTEKEFVKDTEQLSALLKEAKYLETVDFSGFRMTDQLIDAISSTKIKHLIFGNIMDVESYSMKLAEAIQKNENLTGFELNNTSLDQGELLLKVLNQTSNLTKLSLDSNMKQINEEKLYEALLNLSCLNHLNLPNFQPKLKKELSNFIILSKNLQTLNIDSLKMRNRKELIDSFDKNVSLTKFRFSDHLRTEIKEFQYFRQMVQFFMRRNQMNFIGIQGHFRCFRGILFDIGFNFEF